MRKKINLLAQTTKNDFPLVRENLLKHSVANEYEDARKEWVLVDIIEMPDSNFVEHCELCHTPELKRNYIVRNIYTEAEIKVGSTCIKKFLLINGATTPEENLDKFYHASQTILTQKALQELMSKIIDKPTLKDVKKFRHISKKILGTLDGKQISPETWQKYLDLVFGQDRPSETIKIVKTALFDPKSFKFKIDLGTHEEEGHWAHRIKSKPKNILHGVGRATKTIMEKRPGEE